MECGKIDIAMLVLMAVLVVAVGALYLFIVPAMFVLFGIAAQCIAEDQFARFVAYISAVIGSAFIGHGIANLIDCKRKDKENE
jgi:hypothetical protein